MLITDPSKLTKYYACHRVWQGIPGIARTKGGRTFLSFYSGDVKENYGNFAVLLKSDTESDFGEPIAAVEKAGKFRCFDPVLWIDPLERLWFIWNVMPGEEVYASICEDPDAEELQWSDEFYIGRGIMMNKPTVLSTGEWLFPIAMWRFQVFEHIRKCTLTQTDVSGSYVYKTSDNGKTFVKLGYAEVPNRTCDEHMVVELNNGVLMMLVRTNYGIGVSYSYDRGKNWSHGEPSELKGPGSRFFISRLRSGRLLFISHHNFTGRNNLTAFLSEDDGKTFPYSLLLDGRNQVSYPDAVERDGCLYIVYDRERGCFKDSLEEAYGDAREVLTAKITEEDILNGTINPETSYLQKVVCKLDRLAPEDPDPYAKDRIGSRALAEELLQSDATDIIREIFVQFPENCASVRNLDAKKLDALINQFRESDNRDIDILIKIIDLVRLSIPEEVKTCPILEKVKAYVEENLGEGFTVAALAEKLNISLYYLSHLFKAKTGTTIVEYRNELRLMKAKQLLVGTELSISEIAQQVGFCNASYFAEVFLQSEKISPREYRGYHKL